MKKSVLLESIYQSVNGGRASTDSSITRAQINAILPAAVNYALTGDYWGNIRMEGDREVPGAFITVLKDREVFEDNEGKFYAELPESLSNVGGNGGIRFIEDCYGNIYSPRPQGTPKSHWDDVLVSLREFQHIGKRLRFFNMNSNVRTLDIGVILEASSLDDDAEVPMPAGTEVQVIDIMRAFFKDQRMNPKDYIINGVDPVNSTTNG